LKVEELPIDDQTIKLVTESGVSTLYPTQEDAIKAGALEGRNLVLAKPNKQR